jgi:hypothetical protein
MNIKFNNSILSFLIFILSISFSNFVNAQTAGTLTFNYTTPVPGSNAKQNVLAVWIENSNGTFIKTRCRYWGNGTNDHLPAWKSKSGQNTVDAISGATLKSTTNPTAFGAKTITWNGTDVNGNVVTDGTYKVLVESSWCNPEPSSNQHKFLSTFTFEKSSTLTTISPTDANLSNVTITWAPATSGIQNNELENLISIYPNPSTGLVNIKFDKSINAKYLSVTSADGKLLYTEQIGQSYPSEKVLDLNKLNDGLYYMEIIKGNGNVVTKSFLLKK